MNDIRREIIDLIEPYMDKALSSGCIISDSLKYIPYNDIEIFILIEEYDEKTEIPVHIIDKILWHYDITAVLKYINAIVWESNIREVRITQNYIEVDIKWEVYIETLEIPNKPLTLYTEQEEKALLELLTKLG